MIHIITVHFEDDSWINIQKNFFEDNFSGEYKFYVSLEGIAPSYEHDSYFYKTYETLGRHHTKLNILADLVFMSEGVKDEDILIFVDGDAFPIKPIDVFITENLKKYPLIAVQRLENNGDCQPHPCFTATTVGFWKKIKGDWNKGYSWKNNEGQSTTDTGGTY